MNNDETTINNNETRKEVRVRSIGNARHKELTNVANYYSVSVGEFVKRMIIDYLEKVPEHMKKDPLIEK